MRLRELPLRSRVLLVLAILAAICAAFYAVPRVITTWPRFDENAWAEATQALRAEVGSPSVDGGAFAVPRKKLSCPYRGHATLTVDDGVKYERRWWMLVVAPGASRLVACKSKLVPAGGHWRPYDPRTASLTDTQARRIWTALRFLSSVQSAPPPDAVIETKQKLVFMSCFADATWPRWRVAERTTETKPLPLPTLVGMASQARYLDSLSASLAWSTSPGDTVPAMIDWLRMASRPFTRADREAASWPVERYLSLHPDVRAVAPLCAVSYEVAWNKYCSFGWWRTHVPFFRYPTRPDPFVQDYNEGTFRFIEAVAGRSPQEQCRIATAIALSPEGKAVPATLAAPALDPRNEHTLRRAALMYLAATQGDKWCETLLKHAESVGAVPRTAMAMYYDELPTASEARLARLGVNDPAPGISCYYRYHLFRITRDLACLDPLWQMADAPGLSRGDGHNYASQTLAWAYCLDPSVGDLPAFFREHLNEDSWQEATSTIAKKGGPENDQFLSELILDRAKALRPFGYDPNDEDDETTGALNRVRIWVASYQAFYNPSSAADSLCAFLKSPEASRPQGPFRDRAIAILGTVGDASALRILEELYAQQRSNVTWQSSKLDDPEWLPPGPACYTAMPDPVTLLSGSITAIRCRQSPDPLAFLRSLDDASRKIAVSGPYLPTILAAKYSTEELEALLADPSHAWLRQPIYSALVYKRWTPQEIMFDANLGGR